MDNEPKSKSPPLRPPRAEDVAIAVTCFILMIIVTAYAIYDHERQAVKIDALTEIIAQNKHETSALLRAISYELTKRELASFNLESDNLEVKAKILTVGPGYDDRGEHQNFKFFIMVTEGSGYEPRRVLIDPEPLEQ